MISKVRAAVSGLVESLSYKPSTQPATCTPDQQHPEARTPTPPLTCRPAFLNLTPEELQGSKDHTARTVLSLKSPGDLHWGTGYAEVINAGKSQYNEDQACCEYVIVQSRDEEFNDNCEESVQLEQNINKRQQSLDKVDSRIRFYYWGLFDGHAGCGCASFASRFLHHHICDQLRDLVSILQQPVHTAAPLCLVQETTTENAVGILTHEKMEPPLNATVRFHLEKQVFPESLVIGALENAFKEMASI